MEALVRSMEWEYVAIEEQEVGGSLVVVGLPSLGMVGPVATRFLVDRLKMRVIGSVQSDALPPSGVAWQGVVTGPMQLFATEMACGLDGRCDRLLVLNSDVPVQPEEMMSLAGALARWAAQSKVGLLVSLEGYPADAHPPGDVLIASNLAGQQVARRLHGQAAHISLTGVAFALLSRANRDRIPAIGLFAPVTAEGGDAKAASLLLRVIDPLVPNIRLSPDDLGQQAEALERQLREEQERNVRAARKLQEQADRSYA
jgi:predicted ATP-grasp superfamily ATP-dependent carboligase